jgi:hypothetical protein
MQGTQRSRTAAPKERHPANSRNSAYLIASPGGPGEAIILPVWPVGRLAGIEVSAEVNNHAAEIEIGHEPNLLAGQVQHHTI